MSNRITNDVFISYAHVDNSEGWVEKFQDSLQNRLAQFGANVTIWRDAKKLGGADIFSDEIFDQLKQSALLISIVSPVAIKSNWCQEERQKFEQFAEQNGGFRVGNVCRAIKVVKTPLDREAHRSLFNTLGFEFFRADSQSDRFHPFRAPDPEFDSKLDELAQEIKRVLEKLGPLREEPTRPAVYVASTISDLNAERTKIIQQLIDWRYRIFPTEPLPINSPDLRPTIQSALESCAFSVHLVSDKRGTIPEGEEKSLDVIQYELADARHIDRIVWSPPNCKPHAAMVESIANGSQQGLERLEGQTQTIEDLKDILASKLNGLEQRSSEAANASGKMNVYVVCDRKDHPFADDAQDRENALKLKSFLDNQGFVVLLPPVNMVDKRQIDKDHRETLKVSDAVVLYWGAADEAWFRETFRALNKARITRRNRPFAAEAIYFSRPVRAEKNACRHYLDLVLDEFEGFRPEGVRPLLERLRKARAAAS